MRVRTWVVWLYHAHMLRVHSDGLSKKILEGATHLLALVLKVTGQPVIRTPGRRLLLRHQPRRLLRQLLKPLDARFVLRRHMGTGKRVCAAAQALGHGKGGGPMQI